MEQRVEELVQIARMARQPSSRQRAFASLIHRFEPSALAVALALAGRGDAASDIVQDAFLRAWERLPDLADPARFGSWLMQIVRNLATDQRRKEAIRRHEPARDQVDDRATSPAEALDQSETALRLREAIAELDEVSRQIVMLRYFQNLNSREIGHMLDLTATAVDMRLHRARQSLRDQLSTDVANGSQH